jgi:uncharacterized membrane protein
LTETLPSPAPATPEREARSPARRLFAPENRRLWIAAVVLIVALALWLSFTPGGLLGKADAVGYAVCHRIEARSFHFPGGRPLPMCARCSGTFLGVLVGLLTPGLVFRRRRAGLFPPIPVMAVMLAMSGWWAFDGANSFAHMLPGRVPRLYAPTNFLRLATGMVHGITMGGLVLPIFNATLWADATPGRTIESLGEWLLMIGIGALLVAMMLSGLAIFLYPLAILSAAGTMAVLAAINTVIVTITLGQENRASTLLQALPMIFLGLVVTLAMTGAIDALRHAAFGTWDGFVIPETY